MVIVIVPCNNVSHRMLCVLSIAYFMYPKIILLFSLLQGVENLPDYSKVNFPNMQPLSLSLVLPQAHPDDLAFLKHFLVLDPAGRLPAQDALSQLNYFSASPLPSSCSDLQVPIRVKSDSDGISADKLLAAVSKPVSSLEEFMAVVDKIVSPDIL